MSNMVKVKVYTDAAGGACNKIKNGVGSFCPPSEWCYMPWPELIRDNRKNTLGVRFASKLACLEGFGALLGLVMIPEKARNASVEIFVDNSGFVGVYGVKHHCLACPYTYTIAKALYDVSQGLNCQLTVTKTQRVSGSGEIVADALSKGDWDQAWSLMPRKNIDPSQVPVSMLRWIQNPDPDMSLGSKILADMSKYTKVLYLD